MRAAVFLVVSTGCSSILGIEGFKIGDAGTQDSGSNYCLGSSGWMICLETVPTEVRNFMSAVNLRTTDSEFCLTPIPSSWMTVGQPDACIIVADEISVTSTLEATGTRPLVLLAVRTIRVAGKIDVASHTNTSKAAAAATSAKCESPTAATGKGGGAGGSFMTRGGDGGMGATSPTAPGEAAAPDSASPSTLRGGCSGADGAPAPGQIVGVGGVGGGAVYLLAGGSIVLDNGTINASGAAGRGAGADSGGGGGGSGGMIVLSAPAITGVGVLMANGGGGAGGGGGGLGSANGMESTLPLEPAKGAGVGAGNGGVGGNGFAGITAATAGGTPVTAAAAGGGGGGGAGIVMGTSSPPNQIAVSPAFRML